MWGNDSFTEATTLIESYSSYNGSNDIGSGSFNNQQSQSDVIERLPYNIQYDLSKQEFPDLEEKEEDEEVNAEENEDENEALESEVIENEPVRTSRTIWMELCAEFEVKRKEIEMHKAARSFEWCAGLPTNPVIKYLEDNIFTPVLINGMISMLHQAVEDDSLVSPKTTFNGLDFLVEYLWNSNPNQPDRKENWTYIFDMDWTQKLLEENPRPYYPFSRIWTQEQAALRIQAYLRGYWVRRQNDVQQVRQFWKDFKFGRKQQREKSRVDIFEEHQFYY